MPHHSNNLQIYEHAPILEDILGNWDSALGADRNAYKNHCYRVLNFCLAFSGERPESIHKVSIATAFHDLGIWTNGTFDYLEPSRSLAREYLAGINQDAWSEEIETMIELHHKISKYSSNPDWLVEPFRRADWLDVTRGMLKFGLPSGFVADVMSRFPNAGFHKRLIALTGQRLKTDPFSPLPMMRL